MSTREDFLTALNRLFYDAFRQEQPSVEVNAGDLHRRVGDYPGPNHRMPVCCAVMRSAMAADGGDIVLNAPPRGDGASLTIRYVLPRREET